MASLRVICAMLIVGCVVAQDPAPGWLGYAKGVNPSGTGFLTYIEAKWKVGAAPRPSNSFFSPWFGIESSDNLNLIQPVNPWTGNQWLMYNEYFQWSPTHNINSPQHVVKPGNILFGSVRFNPKTMAYDMVHTDMTSGVSVNTSIPIQKKGSQYKQFTIVYFVFEKDAPCGDYPPDGSVTFYDIAVEYNNTPVQMKWTTAYVDDVCNNRAKIVNENTIQISWNTKDTDGPAPVGKAVQGLHSATPVVVA